MAVSPNRPILGLRTNIEAQKEASVVERARHLLVAEGLLSSSVVLNILPKDSDWRRHPNSDATYLVEQEIGPNVIYVSILNPDSLTHRHRHQDKSYPYEVYETYICVEGEATLILDDRYERKFLAGHREKVLPGTRHQLKTGKTSAVLAIVLENGSRYPRDKRHIDD